MLRSSRSRTQPNPYLNFPGKAEEAFEFYKSALGPSDTLMAINTLQTPVPGNNIHIAVGRPGTGA